MTVFKWIVAILLGFAVYSNIGQFMADAYWKRIREGKGMARFWKRFLWPLTNAEGPYGENRSNDYSMSGLSISNFEKKESYLLIMSFFWPLKFLSIFSTWTLYLFVMTGAIIFHIIKITTILLFFKKIKEKKLRDMLHDSLKSLRSIYF
jgi:hypothetical protein